MACKPQIRNRAAPSAWIVRFSDRVPEGAPVLDLACGGGRHAVHFLSLGHPVLAVDRDLSKIADLDHPGLSRLETDLEGAQWPLVGRTFGGVVVTNYLYRPLMSHIVASVAPGGVLIYETFALGNEKFGKPANPEYLLRPGELLDGVQGRLRVLAYEDLTISEPRPRCVQRLCARHESG